MTSISETLGAHRVERLYPEVLLDRPEELDRYLTHVMTVNYRGSYTVPVIEDFDGCSDRRRLGLLVSRLTFERGQDLYDLKIYNPDRDDSILPVSIDGEQILGLIAGFAVDFAKEEVESVIVYDPDGERIDVQQEHVLGLRSRLYKAVDSAARKKIEFERRLKSTDN